jgi:hypothetical protein
MQKALVQMNIQLATVIADVVGVSGQAINYLEGVS